ncbi:hypothetical protein [Streptomyces sp. ISL-94]|uniref:hypothetical protein n=1 Tax=Streptomyces sp. ISL-94 TaxID=2819190 RepID=UPI001BE6CEDC|nr:hypothetical protein [Streptomyces sp. ISL-94]MBT2482329.1 hypothetical protein [Streptomyces sp. ISL-94]
MTASEKPDNAKTNSGSSRASSNGTTTRQRATTRAARATTEAAADANESVTGTLAALPAPLVEKTYAAAQAVRGTLSNLGWVWTAVRERKTITAIAAGGTAAALTGTYAIGRRAGLRQRGPLSRLTGGRI